MISLLKELFFDESGATAIEYGLIAALVSVAFVMALQVLGLTLNTVFGTLSNRLDAANDGHILFGDRIIR